MSRPSSGSITPRSRPHDRVGVGQGDVGRAGSGVGACVGGGGGHGSILTGFAVLFRAGRYDGGVSNPERRLDLLKTLGDNTRYAIYLELARSPRPLSTSDVAESLGLHANTVRPAPGAHARRRPARVHGPTPAVRSAGPRSSTTCRPTRPRSVWSRPCSRCWPGCCSRWRPTPGIDGETAADAGRDEGRRLAHRTPVGRAVRRRRGVDARRARLRPCPGRRRRGGHRGVHPLPVRRPRRVRSPSWSARCTAACSTGSSTRSAAPRSCRSTTWRTGRPVGAQLAVG